jgi:hypothetical protein
MYANDGTTGSIVADAVVLAGLGKVLVLMTSGQR